MPGQLVFSYMLPCFMLLQPDLNEEFPETQKEKVVRWLEENWQGSRVCPLAEA